MNNILNREDLCGYFPEVILRPASRLVPTMITLVGIIILVWASSLTESNGFSAALFMIGVVALAIGIITLIRPTRSLRYLPTGEKVVRHLEGYEQEARSRIEQALATGDIEALNALKSHSNSTPLVVVTYSTPSGSLCIGQVLHYVPYEYEPLGEPVVHKKSN